MKSKSVHSCRFVQHAKIHCIMTTLNKLFKIEFERGELEKSQIFVPSFEKIVTEYLCCGIVLSPHNFGLFN